jgi:hypothetical protein
MARTARQKRYYIRKSHKVYVGVEGIDYVECRVCGLRNLYMDARHLSNHHNLTKEEYLEKFPNAPIISEKKRKAQSRPNNKGRTGMKNSREHCRAISKAQKKQNSFFGKTHSKETREKIRAKGNKTLQRRYGVSNPMFVPKFAAKALDNRRSGFPNKFEQYFDYLTTDDIYYVGNGKLWVTFSDGTHKNPDFKIKKQRKVIELFGDYWHDGDNPQELIDKYKDINFDCLVIWETELYDRKEEVLRKVEIFLQE